MILDLNQQSFRLWLLQKNHRHFKAAFGTYRSKSKDFNWVHWKKVEDLMLARVFTCKFCDNPQALQQIIQGRSGLDQVGKRNSFLICFEVWEDYSLYHSCIPNRLKITERNPGEKIVIQGLPCKSGLSLLCKFEKFRLWSSLQSTIRLVKNNHQTLHEDSCESKKLITPNKSLMVRLEKCSKEKCFLLNLQSRAYQDYLDLTSSHTHMIISGDRITSLNDW